MENFKEYPNDEYGSGIELDEYNGEFSLVNARKGTDGKVWKEWCYPQRDKKPVEKSLPWKVKLGTTKAEAVDTLRYFISLLGGNDDADMDPDLPF